MVAFLIVLMVITFFLGLLLMPQLITGVESLSRWISQFLKMDFSAFVTLEGMVNETTFLRKDGGMVTVIEYAGATQVMGNKELREMTDSVDRFFSTQMNGRGHDIQVVYRQDGGSSKSAISRALERARDTAKRIGLNIGDVLDSDEEKLRNVVIDERIWIVVSTSLAVLESDVIMEDGKRRSEMAREAKLPRLHTAPNPVRIMQGLIPKHAAFTDEVLILFNETGKTSARKLDCHDVVASIRREIQQNSTSPEYRPCLPGDKIPGTIGKNGKMNWDDIYYPPIWSQACTSDIKEIYEDGMEIIYVDGIYHGTVAMDLPPQTPERFDALMKRIRHIPFRISYRIYNSGIDAVSMNYKLVQFLSFNPKSENRAIKNAIEEITQTKGDVGLSLALTITTWSDDRKAVVRNINILQRTLQSWGGCDAISVAGDATALFVSSLPALSQNTPARNTLNSGSDIAMMLPMFRPASLWTDGAVILTSPDGRMMPFQPGSGLQNAWVYLFFATMGSGKSTMLNTIELGMVLAPGLTRLPLMVILDVGESVSGLISIVQSSLPDDRKHEAGYFKMRMTDEYTYNVFDTQLGFRHPLPRDREFLRNFLTMIATPSGANGSPPMMSELMGMVIDEAYRELADDKSPLKFQRGADEVVDAEIDRLMIKVDQSSTWWEVVDDLFVAGSPIIASRAQRYAVPTLGMIPAILKSGLIADLFGRSTSGAELIDTASIMINSAIRDFPIMSGVTKWDIGVARVIGIDLNDVRGAGESGAKQTALMYAIAQQSAAKNFYIDDSMLKNCKEIYREYHKERVRDIYSELKAIIYDEFHNTKGIEGIRKIVDIDIREGRKWNIMVMLSSQLVEDFDESAIKNATGVFILSSGSEEVVNDCRRTFGLSESAVYALKTEVKGPGTGLAIFNTKMGQNIQVFKNHLSPIRMWGFTTVSEEKMLRKYLYEAMPAPIARRMLAERFPNSGQFKSHIERARSNLVEGDSGDIIGDIARKMIDEYYASLN